MPKWEYCAVGPLGAWLHPIANKQEHIYTMYIKSDGIDKRTLYTDGMDLQVLVSKLIAFLGENGWELVSAGTVTASPSLTYRHRYRRWKSCSHICIFKRQLPD
jgi:hypothetical protein